MEQYRREQERITYMYRCRELFLLWQCHVLVSCFFLWPMFKFNIVNPSHDLTTTYENLCTERSSRTKGRKKQLQVIYRNNHKLEIVWSHSFFWAQNNNCTLELGQLNVTLCPRVSLLMRIFLSQAFTLTHIHTHRLTFVTHAVSLLVCKFFDTSRYPKGNLQLFLFTEFW